MDQHLTFPHLCYQCGNELTDEDGEWYQSKRPGAKTECRHCCEESSTYSLFHRCRNCSQLLESPQTASGQSFCCPQCQAVGEVPGNYLLEVGDVDTSFETHFEIKCPSCSEQWAVCREDAGQIASCLECNVPFKIPQHGKWLPFNHAPTTTSRIRCIECTQKVPHGSQRCPACGADCQRPEN